MPKSRKKDKSPGAGRQEYTGRLEVSRSGMGFVIVDGLERDIMIKPENIHTALNGDEVKVEVRGYKDGARRIEGYITSVVRRKQNEFSGRVEVHPHFAFFIADGAKMTVDIFIPLHLLNGAKNGDSAMARIVEWTGKTKNPVGEIISVLTNESANEIAMQALLAENGFPLTFPDDVLEDAARYPEGVAGDEIKKRKDLRDTLTITIDPADAKDFDDALSFRILEDDLYEVGVHIADVSYYIEPGSALDKEAYRRATSVYLPDRVSPMLPERLSNELCSLRPNEDKYTFSVLFEINKAGKIRNHWIGKTIIHSNRRYAYEDVQAVLEQDGATASGAEPYAAELHTLNSIARNLRSQRFKKGAINFSSQEVRFVLDENAVPTGIVIKESKEAHQLIEEFMLLANKTVAAYVGGLKVNGAPVPFPYRVHDVPVDDKLKIFTMFAGRFGVKFDLSSPGSISQSFNNMLATVSGKPEQHVLEQLGIRTMSKAVYTTDNIGHYGLGFDYYCHFTSPIRRYPDVLVHRILQQCIAQDIHPMKQLEVQCRHCSDQERRAMEAERSANKYKQVEFMQAFVGEDFDAIISGVATFGFWAETVAHKCEGMVSATDLAEFDDFEFKEEEYALVGRKTGIRFTMGDKVRVRVASTNLAKRQIDYAITGLPAKAPRKKQPQDTGKKATGRKSAPAPAGNFTDALPPAIEAARKPAKKQAKKNMEPGSTQPAKAKRKK